MRDSQGLNIFHAQWTEGPAAGRTTEFRTKTDHKVGDTIEINDISTHTKFVGTVTVEVTPAHSYYEGLEIKTVGARIYSRCGQKIHRWHAIEAVIQQGYRTELLYLSGGPVACGSGRMGMNRMSVRDVVDVSLVNCDRCLGRRSQKGTK